MELSPQIAPSRPAVFVPPSNIERPEQPSPAPVRRRRRSTRAAFANGTQVTSLPPGERQQVVLVAEDDRVLLSGIASLLRSAGYGCIRARNGDEAIARFGDANGEVDLLLLDIFMPGTDGVSAWRRIHRADPEVQCIIMSGVFDRELALRLGPAAFLPKPFQPADLLVAVRDVLMPEPH